MPRRLFALLPLLALSACGVIVDGVADGVKMVQERRGGFATAAASQPAPQPAPATRSVDVAPVVAAPPPPVPAINPRDLAVQSEELPPLR